LVSSPLSTRKGNFHPPISPAFADVRPWVPPSRCNQQAAPKDWVNHLEPLRWRRPRLHRDGHHL